MSEVDREQLVTTYLADLLKGAEIDPTTHWAWDVMSYLIYEDPESAWPIMLEILHRATEPIQIACLGAGALESLISNHAATFIDRVEGLARHDPILRRALSYAYFSDLDPAIQARLAAASAPQ